MNYSFNHLGNIYLSKIPWSSIPRAACPDSSGLVQDVLPPLSLLVHVHRVLYKQTDNTPVNKQTDNTPVNTNKQTDNTSVNKPKRTILQYLR